MESYNDRRLKEMKQMTELRHIDVDDPVFQKLANAHKLPEPQRKELLAIILSAMEKGGNYALLRAFEEGVLTEQEWLIIKKDRGLSISDMGVILMLFFKKRDNPAESLEDEIVIMTQEGSGIYNQRDFVKERFGIRALSPDEIRKEKKEQEDKK